MNVDKNISVAWIGTGVMGVSMLGHLHDAGYECATYNRTKSKAEVLLAKGVKWEESPGEAAKNADVIFTIVGFPKDVREVYFGEKGILANAKSGAIVVDMTTTEPSLAIEIYEAALNKGIQSIDAPVSGGDVGAKKCRTFDYGGWRCRSF